MKECPTCGSFPFTPRDQSLLLRQHELERKLAHVQGLKQAQGLMRKKGKESPKGSIGREFCFELEADIEREIYLMGRKDEDEVVT